MPLCVRHGNFSGANPWDACPKCIEVHAEIMRQREDAVMKTVQQITQDLCKGHEFIDYAGGSHQCRLCGLSERKPAPVTACESIAHPPETVRTDKEPYDLTQMPFEAEKRIGAIFIEGESKYGRDNWKKGTGNKQYQIERANHALKHLKIYIHQLTTGEEIGEFKNGEPEDDLAKVAWFCCTQMEIERLESLEEVYEPTRCD